MKNIQLQSLITELKRTSIDVDVKLWKRLASELEKPTKKRTAVNLSRINRYSEENDVVVVPGKVLGMGVLDKKITLAAYNFSGEAVQKIKDSGSKMMTLKELLKTNPKGDKVRIMG